MQTSSDENLDESLLDDSELDRTIQSALDEYPGLADFSTSTPVEDVPVRSESTSQSTDVKEDGVLMSTAKEFVRNGNTGSAYRAIAFGILDRAKATASQKQTWEDRLTELDDFVRNHPGN